MRKTAVVTGGAGGIGRAVAARLARENQIVLLDISGEAGAQVVADCRRAGVEIEFQRVDVSKDAEVQIAFEKIKSQGGRIDALINVAGGSVHRHPLDEFPLDHWRAVIDANLTSTFLCCRAATPMMKAQGGGAIVNISSDIAFSGDAGRS